jgi:CRISPR-associated protein Cas1
MGLLLLDRAALEIKSEGDTLALYEAGTRRGTVPIKLIDRCVIQGSQTRLDSGVLIKLAEAGATTVLMSMRYPRRAAVVLGRQHNDVAIRLAQTQRVFNIRACRQWAYRLVLAKLKRQYKTLLHIQNERPDARKPLFDALGTIKEVIRNFDPVYCAMSLEKMRGLEGAAARAYFGGLATAFAPSLHFAGRNRRPPRDPVNVCLSLSYTMLNVQAVQMCIRTGLDPLLGFYHRPTFGRESLACDLIEPLRPAVDLWVWEMLRSGALNADHFAMDRGACLLGKAGRHAYYTAWDEASKAWDRWLRAQCKILAADLQQKGLRWIADQFQDDDALDLD